MRSTVNFLLARRRPVLPLVWLVVLANTVSCGLEQLGPPPRQKTAVSGEWRKECVNVVGLGSRLCRIPPGWVETGDHFSLDPVRRFEVDDFWLADAPVANADYERFRPEHQRDKFSKLDDSPVTAVTWHEARDYLRWLGERVQLDLRLPTSIEWHYACLGGQQGPLPWGSYRGRTLDEQKSMADILASEAAPIRSFQPGPFGLYDMVGGVSEWVADWQVYDPKGNPIFDDHPAYAAAPRKLRATKGCSAEYASFVFCECNYTSAYDPNLGLGSIGFRIAVSELPAGARDEVR